MDIILQGEPVKMDVVQSNKGYFLYVSAIGTYVDISYVTDSNLKKYLGPLAYHLTGIKEFFTIPMMKSIIEHDNGVVKGYYSLMLVVNSKKVAGFNIIDKPIVLIIYLMLFGNFGSFDKGYLNVHSNFPSPLYSNILFVGK